MNLKHLSIALLSCISLNACTSASHHAQEVKNNECDRITVGNVQRTIKIGMSSADVVTALGSPNIIATDDQRREQWVYDKIATDTVYSTSSGGVGALVLGFGGFGAVIPGASYGSASGAKSTNQRTLTVIVKFDAESKVRDFAYHNSSF